VETEAVLDKLHDYGIDYAQGYLISKPVSAEQLWRTICRVPAAIQGVDKK